MEGAEWGLKLWWILFYVQKQVKVQNTNNLHVAVYKDVNVNIACNNESLVGVRLGRKA